LRAAVGPPDTTAFNVTVIEAADCSLSTLRASAGALPFLAERRLVIVKGFLGRASRAASERDSDEDTSEAEPSGADATASASATKGARSGRKAPRSAGDSGILDFLRALPATADIVFLENTEVASTNPIYKLAVASGKVVADPRARDVDLGKWIRRRAKEHGTEFEPAAIDRLERLSRTASSSLRDIDADIAKLALYAGPRTVRVADIDLHVTATRDASVFTMVDAIGRRQSDRALAELHRLIDQGEPVPRLVAMISRQFRLLIQVRELHESGDRADSIAARLRLHPFQAEKLVEQARSFSLPSLERAYADLVTLDEEVKTGRADQVTAIDLYIAEQITSR
jgi:DNA polymerase III subunit delta